MTKIGDITSRLRNLIKSVNEDSFLTDRLDKIMKVKSCLLEVFLKYYLVENL